MLQKFFPGLIVALVIVSCTFRQTTSTSTVTPTSTATKTVAVLVQPSSTPPPPTSRQFLRFSATQRDCWNLGLTQPTISQVEVVQCAQDDLNQQKAKLASLISEIKLRVAARQQQTEGFILLPADTQEKLDDIQKEWEELIDEHCKWEMKFSYGSSSAPMVYISCMAARTNERIQQLKFFLCDGEGASGSCPAAEKY